MTVYYIPSTEEGGSVCLYAVVDVKLNGKIQHCVTVSLFGFEPILGKCILPFSTLQIISQTLRSQYGCSGFLYCAKS